MNHGTFHRLPLCESLSEVCEGNLQRSSHLLLSQLGKKYTAPPFLFPLYPVISIMWFVPFHFHNGFLSSLMETYGDPFSLYRICPALMDLRLDSGTYVCLDDSAFLVPFSTASYIIHRVKAVLLCRRSHLLTWKSLEDQKAWRQSHQYQELWMFTNRCDWNNYQHLISVLIQSHLSSFPVKSLVF